MCAQDHSPPSNDREVIRASLCKVIDETLYPDRITGNTDLADSSHANSDHANSDIGKPNVADAHRARRKGTTQLCARQIQQRIPQYNDKLISTDAAHHDKMICLEAFACSTQTRHTDTQLHTHPQSFNYYAQMHEYRHSMTHSDRKGRQQDMAAATQRTAAVKAHTIHNSQGVLRGREALLTPRVSFCFTRFSPTDSENSDTGRTIQSANDWPNGVLRARQAYMVATRVL
jgi:hypothetical protein